MASFDLADSDHLDYAEYSRLQKEAFSELLEEAKVSDNYIIPEYYKWKYNPPAGKAKITLVREGDRILASNAMLPLEIKFLDKKLIGWESCDTATLPEARGKGYFRNCLNMLKNEVKPDEIFFGFPNRNSINGFIKLGWDNWGFVTTWINPISFLSKESVDIKEISRFKDEHDIFFNECAKYYDIMIIRSAAYMNWRYADNPVNDYSLLVYFKDGKQIGCSVLRTATVLNRYIIIIMELWALNSEAENKIFRHITWWAGKRDIAMCVLLDSRLSFLNGLRSGFMPVWHKLLPKKQLLMGCISDDTIPANFIKNKWRIQTGDWDSF